MTPAARVQAAIEILDDILAGSPAEKALTGWARRSRFAGSKDRAAVRDHVFDALRCTRSFAAVGGARTGRGLMLGACRVQGKDPEDLFTGERHAPSQVATSEMGRQPESDAERLDIPDWLWPQLEQSLGDDVTAVARALQARAPVHLRVNRIKAGRDHAITALAREGVETAPHPACDTALVVTAGERRINQSAAYLDGLVELQDAASQSVVETLPLKPGMRVLDFCAGGGGKSLALSAHSGVTVFAHDVAPERMRDLPNRARRAGARINTVRTDQITALAPFDLILIDAPCSGSGSWRRAPAGKWALTPDRLAELTQTQKAILRQAAGFVAPDGVLAYATCSVLGAENAESVRSFLQQNPDWARTWSKSWVVAKQHDGFFCAHLTRV